MLSELNITNIVLIAEASVTFERGLCVLTGETGAGKSIILDALGLILGQRADAKLIRSGAEKAAVSAVFDVENHTDIAAILSDLGMEPEPCLIIRRQLDKEGKSKCFVNDQPVSLNTLKALAPYLVEIHGQHDQRGLFDPAIHRQTVDAFGQHQNLLKETEQAFQQWKHAQEALQAALDAIEKARKEEEYLRHIAADLGALNPEAGEEEALSDKRNTMMQSEKLFSVLNDALGELQSGGGVTSTIISVQRTLSRSPLTSGERFEAIISWLDDASDLVSKAEQELEAIGRESEFSQATMDKVEERLFSIRDAVRKYKVPADELADVLQQARAALASLDHDTNTVKTLQARENQTRQHYQLVATKLRDARAKASRKLEVAVVKELAPLKMQHTVFHIASEPLAQENWARHGMDQLVFQVATNVSKGETPEFAALQKIASGGELSRFMLALKVALAGVRSTPTMIFDEIDTGTGGQVADAIGKRLAMLGRDAQVLVVTHLPQVAAFGKQHLLVSKQAQKGKITTAVSSLSTAERKEELARMLAGEEITKEARSAAVKLLESAA